MPLICHLWTKKLAYRVRRDNERVLIYECWRMLFYTVRDMIMVATHLNWTFPRNRATDDTDCRSGLLHPLLTVETDDRETHGYWARCFGIKRTCATLNADVKHLIYLSRKVSKSSQMLTKLFIYYPWTLVWLWWIIYLTCAKKGVTEIHLMPISHCADKSRLHYLDRVLLWGFFVVTAWLDTPILCMLIILGSTLYGEYIWHVTRLNLLWPYTINANLFKLVFQSSVSYTKTKITLFYNIFSISKTFCYYRRIIWVTDRPSWFQWEDVWVGL